MNQMHPPNPDPRENQPQAQTDKLAFIDQVVAHRQANQQFRSLQILDPLDSLDPVLVQKQGKPFLNFSANDYLGLSKHPALIQAAQEATARYGVGATASRLVTGTYGLHAQIEEKLAHVYGREAALLFNTGFQANATILTALVDRQSLVLCDRQIHNSLLQGILASRAQFIRFRHNDFEHLETLLRANPGKRVVIVTETLFSMGGDRANVDRLIDLADRYQALLYLDDAHAIGVLGQNGWGLTAHRPGIDIAMGTFGKAMGSFGAFVTCSRQMRDYLINTCPGLIYTTALPPPVLGAIAAALDLIPTLDQARDRLLHHSQNLRHQLQGLGYNTGTSDSQIIPVIVGAESQALALAQQLEHQGILVIAIRPPTVAPGTARIRLALSSHHRAEHYQRLLTSLNCRCSQDAKF
jgi:8-amino-7-oxononanoate synthase